MKIKKFNESIRDHMKPINVIEKRTDILDKMIDALTFIKWVASDFQFNVNDPDYIGFINVALEDFSDDDEKKNFKAFVDMYVTYKDILDMFLKELKLEVEDGVVDIDETVINSITK